MKFSVIENKWIPVQYTNGESEIVSIREAFQKANEIKELAADFEMTNLAVYRLLFAFYMDIYRPEKKSDKEADLEKETFDMNLFDEYISECRKDGECFDLFDPKKPFLQTANMDTTDNLKSVAVLSEVAKAATETTFFFGKREDEYAFTPEMCALELCTKSATVFKAKQGEGYQSFTPLQNAIFMLNKGKNLKETIILNAIPKQVWLETETMFKYGTEEGLCGPTWKQGEKTDHKKNLVEVEYSLLSMMTFMPVNIKLVQDEDGLVRRIAYTSKRYARKKENENDERDPIEMFQDPYTIQKKIEAKKNGVVIEQHYRALEYDHTKGFWETIEAIHVGSGKNIFKPLCIPDDSIRTLEIWSACKNGNGRGIVLHEIFDIKMDFLVCSNREIIDDSMIFENIINNFGCKYIKEHFANISLVLRDKYISDIQRLMRQYMSMTYFKDYINKINVCEDPFESEDIRKDYKISTIYAFRDIALNYLDQFDKSFKSLKNQTKCRKAINVYFSQYLDINKNEEDL